MELQEVLNSRRSMRSYDAEKKVTKEQLETGANWELANNNASSSKKYFPIKAIAIAQIVTRG